MKKPLFLCLGAVLLSASGYAQKNKSGDQYSAYLFVYFTGNNKSEEALRFALSNDGYNYRALNNNNPVIRLKR